MAACRSENRVKGVTTRFVQNRTPAKKATGNQRVEVCPFSPPNRTNGHLDGSERPYYPFVLSCRTILNQSSGNPWMDTGDRRGQVRNRVFARSGTSVRSGDIVRPLRTPRTARVQGFKRAARASLTPIRRSPWATSRLAADYVRLCQNPTGNIQQCWRQAPSNHAAAVVSASGDTRLGPTARSSFGTWRAWCCQRPACVRRSVSTTTPPGAA